MPHQHADPIGSHSNAVDQRRLALALVLISSFMIGEVIVGFQIRSLALLADAGHMMTDAGSLGLAIWAIRLAARPFTVQWTFGVKRAEILSAAVNGVVLLGVAVVITIEAVARLLHPHSVHGVGMIIVASVGLVINLVSTFIVHGADQRSLNIAGAMAHLVTDSWAFLGTLVAGVVIVRFGFNRADSIASLLVVVLMAHSSWVLLRDSGRILLEVAPASMDLSEVRRHLLDVEHVKAVHDLHAWVVTSDLPALTAHVVVDDACFIGGTAPHVLDELQRCLSGHFDVVHSTFQLEPEEHAEHEDTHH